MKKFAVVTILFSLLTTQSLVFAEEVGSGQKNIQVQVVAPKWEEYVPEKYQNPRNDFTRASAISELSVGALLTNLIITAPIGVPMICHGVTKFKHVSYRDKKAKFEQGLRTAETIQSPEEKQAYYDKLPRDCHLKLKNKYKYDKQQQKKQAKLDKKTAKNKVQTH